MTTGHGRRNSIDAPDRLAWSGSSVLSILVPPAGFEPAPPPPDGGIRSRAQGLLTCREGSRLSSLGFRVGTGSAQRSAERPQSRTDEAVSPHAFQVRSDTGQSVGAAASNLRPLACKFGEPSSGRVRKRPNRWPVGVNPQPDASEPLRTRRRLRRPPRAELNQDHFGVKFRQHGRMGPGTTSGGALGAVLVCSGSVGCCTSLLYFQALDPSPAPLLRQRAASKYSSCMGPDEEHQLRQLGEALEVVQEWESLTETVPAHGRPKPTAISPRTIAYQHPINVSPAAWSAITAAISHLGCLRDSLFHHQGPDHVQARIHTHGQLTLTRGALENSSIAAWLLSPETKRRADSIRGESKPTGRRSDSLTRFGKPPEHRQTKAWSNDLENWPQLPNGLEPI